MLQIRICSPVLPGYHYPQPDCVSYEVANFQLAKVLIRGVKIEFALTEGV